MIAGANDPAPQLLRRGLAPASGTGEPVFLRRERRRAGSGLDQRHRGPCARLRRCRLPRPVSTRAGAGDPRRSRDAGARRARDVRGLCRGLRDLGRAGAPRPRPPSRARAGTRPAFSARSERAPPAPRCAVSIPSQATMAIALSASQAGGIMANFGTMTKPFHAGRAAHAGLVSARLAELGFTAAADALEHPQGFLSAVSPEGEADRDSPTRASARNGRSLKQGLSIKKYPACYCTHRALDAMLDLLAKRPAEAGRDQPHHRVDQQDAFADPAQSPAADRARGEVQHGVRDGGGGDLAARQPRRIHRRVRPPSRGAGADAPGRRS